MLRGLSQRPTDSCDTYYKQEKIDYHQSQGSHIHILIAANQHSLTLFIIDIESMIQECPCVCVDRNRVKQMALQTMKQIRNEYSKQIKALTKLLEERQAKIVELYHQVNQKQAKWNKQTTSYQAKIHTLNQQVSASKKHNKDIKAQFNHQREQLEQQLDEEIQNYKHKLAQKQKEIAELRKQVNFDVLSTSSSVPKKQRSSSKMYSFDLSEQFQAYPETTLKLLNSLPEEKLTDELEKGDMSCMFISRDELSAEKYVEINKSFLRRKLKQEEKRFRFVIIYKPDKE